MVDDLFDIVLGPVFNDRISKEPSGFDLLYSQVLGVNKRRPIDEGMYPVPELGQPRRKTLHSKFAIVRRQKQELEL